MHLDPFEKRMTRIDYFTPNGTHVLTAVFDGEWTKDGIQLIRRVTLEMRLSDAAVRFDLSKLRLNRQLGPEAFTTPAFDGANRVDLDNDP